LALAVALVGAGLMSDGCVEIVNVLHRHDITVSYLFRYYLHTLFAVLTLIHITCFITLSLSWAAIATKSWVRAGWCLRRGTGCFVGFMAVAAWCTILAAVAIMIVGSVGWAILEIFDKAVCPYQDELSQEIQQKMLNKLNNFFGKNHEQCDTDCLEPYCDAVQGVKRGLRRLIIGASLSFLASLQFSYCLLWLLKHYLMLKKPEIIEDEEPSTYRRVLSISLPRGF